MARKHKKKMTYLFIIFVLMINIFTPLNTKATELPFDTDVQTIHMATEDNEQTTPDSVVIEVEEPYIVLEDFESSSTWKATGAKYNTVDATVSSDEVRFGENSLRLDYDFLNQQGTSGIYASRDTRIEVPGNPKKIGMWIYGDGKKHWLRQQLVDANGQNFNIDFTGDYPNGVTWEGWQYVEADIPANWQAPFKIDLAVRYMATKDEGKSAGTIYVDNIIAIYGEFNADVKNPQLLNFKPSETTTNKPEISIVAVDQTSGIDSTKIEMKIDGQVVTPDFNEETGIISYTPSTPLADGLHQVYIEVFDKEGNHKFNTFTFAISSGGPAFQWGEPEAVLAGSVFDVQLKFKNMNELDGVEFILNYDPNAIDFVDGDQTFEGLQARVEDKFKSTVKVNSVDEQHGEISLQFDGFNAVETSEEEVVATVSFALGNDAAGTAKLELTDGQFSYVEESIGTLPFFSNPLDLAISQPYVLSIEGKSVGTPSKITVKDLQGNPVEGAKIEITNGNKLIKIIKDTQIYKGGSGVAGDPYQDVSAGTYIPYANAPTSKFSYYRIFMPNGQQRYYHVPKDDAEVVDWNTLFDGTDENGEIYTDKLTLSQIPLSIQASKGELVSQVESFTVTPQLGTQKPENITLTWNSDPSTSQHFTWRTGTATQNSVVEVVEETDPNGFSSESVIRVDGDNKFYADDKVEMTIHHADINGLTPGTIYQYRVGDGTQNGWSEVGHFTTASNNEEAYNFLFFTDTQSQDANGFAIWTKLYELGLEKFPNTKFILHGGDIVEDGSVMSQWELFLQASKGLTPKITFMSVLGNHDVYGNGESIYSLLFSYPQNGPEGKEGFVYSFEYGNAKFIMLNSEFGIQDMEQQEQWIREEVEGSTKQWTIAMFHRPPYKSNPLTDQNATATTFAPLLEELGVDLVLNGHDHAYMRTHPMKDGIVQTDGKGTVYVIGGSAGPKFYPVENNEYVDVQFDSDKQVFTSISINGNVLAGEVYTINNELVDSFEIIKKKSPDEQVKPEVTYHITNFDTKKLTITKPSVSLTLDGESIIPEGILFTGSYGEFSGEDFAGITVTLDPVSPGAVIDFKGTVVQKVMIGKNIKEIRGYENIQDIEYLDGASKEEIIFK